MRRVSAVVRAAVRSGLGPQLIRDLLLRAGRRRLIVLKLWDGRFPGSGERFVRGISGSSGHGKASHIVALAGYARREPLTRWEERARDGPTTAQTNPSSTSSHPLSVMTCLCPEPSTTRLQLATTSRSSWIDMRKPPYIPG